MTHELPTKSGLSPIYKTIDYASIKHVNIFYKKALQMAKTETPKFWEKVDKNNIDLSTYKNNQDIFSYIESLNINNDEKHYVFTQYIIKRYRNLSNDDLLNGFQKLSKAYPNDKNLFLLFAKIQIAREQYDDAVHWLQIACNIDEKFEIAWALQSIIAALAHDHSRSLYCARKANTLKIGLRFLLYRTLMFSSLLYGKTIAINGLSSEKLFLNDGKIDERFQTRTPVMFAKKPQKLKDSPIIFFACDGTYFDKFGKYLLLSLLPLRDSIEFHIHIINPDKTHFEWLNLFEEEYNLPVIFSYEKHSVKLNVSYLASARFIHIVDFMEKFDRPYLTVDTDSLLNNVEGLKHFFKNTIYPTLYYVQHGPIWDTLTAMFVYTPNTAEALTFMKNCRAYLSYVFAEGMQYTFWYIDQLALMASYIKYPEFTQLIDGHYLSDPECGQDAFFWTLSNDKDVKKYHDKCHEIEQSAGLRLFPQEEKIR